MEMRSDLMIAIQEAVADWALTQAEAAKRLAPVAPPPIPTAAEKLPLDKLKAPKGFTIEVYASGVDNARTLRLGDKESRYVSGIVSRVSQGHRDQTFTEYSVEVVPQFWLLIRRRQSRIFQFQLFNRCNCSTGVQPVSEPHFEMRL